MRFFLSCLMALAAAAPAFAQPGWAQGEPIIEAQIVSDVSQAQPGTEFHIGIHQLMPEGWHTYWRNPGDNGLPIEIDWTLPDGVEIGEIAWPAPIDLPLTADIMDYGYKDEVTLPMPVRLSDGFEGDSLTLVADATWLVCEDICIPEERVLELTLAVGEAPVRDEAGYWYIQAALDAVPMPDPAVSAELGEVSDQIVLALTGGDFERPQDAIRDLRFYPFKAGLIRHAATQEHRMVEDRTVLVIAPGYAAEDRVQTSRGGVVTYEVNENGRWESRMLEIAPALLVDDMTLDDTVSDVTMPVNYIVIFLLALGGGLILNLMPCVFPILSIKVLKFVQVAHADAAKVRQQGLFFLAGVLVSFVGLAAILVGLREFGLPVGWGFQLQLPIVVAALSVLLFAIGLNLLGVFEVGTRLMGLGSGLAEAPGGRGAFFTGVLAVVVAAPCVGPLAAGALGLALTQPAIIVILVSAAMGLGLALPFVALCFAPGLLRLLPKPGAWMVTFRQLLAFPMFGSALWLVWVISIQSGPAGVLLVGTAMVLLSFGVWALGQGGPVWKAIGVIGLLGAVVSTGWVARMPGEDPAVSVSVSEEAWSPARVAELRAEGRAVFVDVTAAWCVTCQVNKIRVLNQGDVQAAFDAYDVAFLRADWTNRNETIAQLIRDHGQAGVPLYLLYPVGGGPAQVLPTVLTRDGVIAALDRATRR
ncbi:protein-disulfide reductase DsbD family protein [Maricaulis parjimensis]|uniref:protein-disulfide reductase DsbD family protein n=1 Tax=Maricaulis parjimensis TaxID=144023 RepID=UPI00193ACD31|nr:protein-disulfide reductase DsbD domain-containing protein [Maricaulis parjimensis]